MQRVDRRHFRSGPSFTEECHDHTDHFAELRIGQAARQLSLAGSPIQTPDLVGQDDTGHRQILGNSDLEWIALDSARFGAEESEANLAVVHAEGDNTSAGRRPACSWPACGVNESQTMSPRRGT